MNDSELYQKNSNLDLYIKVNLFDINAYNRKYNFKTKTTAKNYKSIFFKRFVKFLNDNKVDSDLITFKDQYNNKLLLDVKPNFSFIRN